GEGAGAQGFAGARVPAWSAGDAEIAAQVASGQRDGEGGDQFQFVGNLDLRAEHAGVGAGAARTGFAGEPVDPAMVGAEMAVRQRGAGGGGAFAREGSAASQGPRPNGSGWRGAGHNSSRAMRSELGAAFAGRRSTF